MAKKKRVRSCPCGSGVPYAECCQPFHEGGEPPTPSALVRSRFCAFSLGLGDYLWRTLHDRHPLRGAERTETVRDLSRARQALRYLALDLWEERVEGDRADVLFAARVMSKGRDRSFVELSRFERVDGAWRYLDGLTRARSEVGEDERSIDAFAAAAASR